MSSKYKEEFKSRDFSRFQEQAGATPDKHLLYVYGQYLRQLQRTEERVAKQRAFLLHDELASSEADSNLPEYIEHETELMIPTLKKMLGIIEDELNIRGLDGGPVLDAFFVVDAIVVDA